MRKYSLISIIISVIMILVIVLLPNPHLIGNYQDFYFYFMYSEIFRIIFLVIGIVVLAGGLISYVIEKYNPRILAKHRLHLLSSKLNRSKAIIIITICFIVGVTILFFLTRNLFSPAELTRYDFPVRYYEMYTIKNGFFLKNFLFFGYSPDFYAGFLGFPFFTPGLSIYGAIFWILKVDPAIYLRILIILTFVLYFSLPYKFNKINGLPTIFYILTLFYMINSIGWSEFVRIGSLFDIYGILLAVIFLYSFLKIIAEIRNNKKPQKYLYPISIFSLQLLIIFQFSYVIFPAIIILLYFIKEIISILKINKTRDINSNEEYQKTRKYLIKSIKITFIILIFAFIGNLFWILTILKNISYINLSITVNTTLSIENNLYARQYFLEYIQNFPILLLPFLIIGIISALKNKKNFIIRQLTISAIVFFIILIVVYFIYPLGIMIFGRSIIIFDFFFPALIFQGFYSTIKKIKLLKIRRYISVIIVGYIVLVGSFSIINRVYYPDNYTYNNPNATEIYSWIDENTNQQSRTLLEDTFFTEQQVWGTGRMISLTPIYTDTTFIGGYYPNFYAKASDTENANTGNFFGENISSISIANFTIDLTKFNIHYIVAWYPETLSYLNSHSNLFKNMTTIGNFTIYNYMNYTDSYCLNKDFKPISSQLYNLSTDYIRLLVKNVTESQKIILSFTNLPQLEVKVNSTVVQTGYDENLMSFNSPSNGDLMVVIAYHHSSIDSILTSVFLISSAAYPILIAYFYIASKRKKLSVKNEILADEKPLLENAN